MVFIAKCAMVAMQLTTTISNNQILLGDTSTAMVQEELSTHDSLF